MTRDDLGRVARAAESAAWVASGGGEPADWEELDAESREGYCVMAEAVRAAVIAAEFGPHASVVTTEYLRNLEALARVAEAYFPAAQPTTTPIGPMQEVMIKLRAYPDWQRKGEPS